MVSSTRYLEGTVYGYLELLQREDPTWSIEELRELVGLTRSVPPTGPSVYSIKVEARTLQPDTYRDFKFPSVEAAAAVEAELGDEFDTGLQSPDLQTLRVWGYDRGIDR